jgi:LDH2 family malate/lactate/ureidoglycolate dehydrogenase
MGANHLGALAPYLWIAAEAGFAAIVTTNTAAMIAPAGGRLPQLGNNPLGIGMPYPGGDPVRLDMALSVVSRSRVRNAAQAGTPIPDTWGTDSDGRPTTDAAAALDGMLLPVGGYKGAGLALVIGLLAGLLNGAAFGHDVSDFNTDQGGETNTGQFVIALDIARFMDPTQFAAEIDRHLRDFKASARLPGFDAIRLPGAERMKRREQRSRDGVTLAPALMKQLDELAGNLNLTPLGKR